MWDVSNELATGSHTGGVRTAAIGARCDGKRARKQSAELQGQLSWTSHHKRWGIPSRTAINWCAEWITGARCWMELAGSMCMGTTALQPGISMATVSTTYISANLRAS